MDFEHSAKAQDYLGRLQDFMDGHVYPAERAYDLVFADPPYDVPDATVEEVLAWAENASRRLLLLDADDERLAEALDAAGIAGVALGFGTQTMVRDFISGFFIVAEDQFGVGDTIDLGGGNAAQALAGGIAP